MSERSETAVTAHGLGGIVRVTIIAVVLAGLLLVALDNRNDVRLGYVTGRADAPLWAVVVVSGIAGLIIGWLIKHRPHRH